MVAPYDWGDIWLNEGPAQYAQVLYAEYALGKEKALELISVYQERVSNNQPLVSPKGSTFRQAYNSDIYFKGALVLHSLRYLMGDEKFFELMLRWTYPEGDTDFNGNHCRYASTGDFINLSEEVYGQELDWFFDVYLFSSQLPKLIIEAHESYLILEWETPDNLPFPMPLNVHRDDKIIRLQMENGKETIYDMMVNRMIVDPGLWVLKKISFQ